MNPDGLGVNLRKIGHTNSVFTGFTGKSYHTDVCKCREGEPYMKEIHKEGVNLQPIAYMKKGYSLSPKKYLPVWKEVPTCLERSAYLFEKECLFFFTPVP